MSTSTSPETALALEQTQGADDPKKALSPERARQIAQSLATKVGDYRRLIVSIVGQVGRTKAAQMLHQLYL